MRQSLLERIVEERVGQTFVGTVSVAVDRAAEEFAREVLADEMFRRTLRTLVRVRSQEILQTLMRKEARRNGDRARPRRSRKRR